MDIERVLRYRYPHTSLLSPITLNIALWPYGSASRELLDR